jgi:hypothetical protein
VLPQLGRPPEPGAEHRPVVYVGRGSHASFFEPGYYETDFYDLCDCRQPPKTTPRLVDVTDPPAWMLWPGHWGSTKLKYAGPSAPGAHEQWTDPDWLLGKARDVPEREPPGAPHLVARVRDERLLVEFDASPCENPPASIVVTVNCSDDKAPPRALRFSVADLLRGRLETRVAIDRRKHYDVRVAASTRTTGRRGRTSSCSSRRTSCATWCAARGARPGTSSSACAGGCPSTRGAAPTRRSPD